MARQISRGLCRRKRRPEKPVATICTAIKASISDRGWIEWTRARPAFSVGSSSWSNGLEAVDLYHFTSLINRSLDEAGRRRVVEMMWEIVFADSRVSEFEDNLLWRAADLLGISGRERIELRQRVAARLQGGVSGEGG